MVGEKVDEYNKDPVFYCKGCLSLKIREVMILNETLYCEECGSTDIGECSIEEWESLYEERYGIKYLDK